MPKKQVASKDNSSQKGIEKALIENFVAIQKVMVNLSGKIDNLTTQISKLLELFEISAKALADKNFSMAGNDNKKVVEKIDSLLEQNKLIARGLTLMHEGNSREPSREFQREQVRYPQPQEYQMPRQKMPNSYLNPIKNPAPVDEGMAGYQRSITNQDSTGNFESPITDNNKKFGKPPRI